MCRSTFAAELLACTAALDHTVSYKSNVEAFGLKVTSIYICTGNNGLRDNLSSIVSTCEEKSLRIELSYLRETLSEEGIKVRWVHGSGQLADVLTKEKSGLELLDILSLLTLLGVGVVFTCIHGLIVYGYFYDFL